VHGPEEFDKSAAIGLKDKIRESAFVVAISSYGQSQLMRQCSYDEWSKISVIRCGLDASYLDREARPVPDVARLVCVGRLSEQKGQLLLLEAAARLREDGIPCELVLAGDGEMRPRVEDVVRRHGLQKEVRITGWLDASGIQRELEDARALVIPSFAEGLPVVIMEAMALGRPVLSTYVAGIPELVVPGETGWLVPAGSVTELARGMKQVLETPPDELTRLGQRGRQRVRALHDVRVSAQELKAKMEGRARASRDEDAGLIAL
jgi:colanic acid/amylovoran biosynthesis glycosyltransferase